MTLFFASIRRDSVSLLKFAFLSHVEVFSCKVLFISRLKRPKSRFSSKSCFLVIVILMSIMLSVSFLMAVMSPPSCFSMLSSSRCIDASTLSSLLVNPFSPLFLILIVSQCHLWDIMPYVLSLVFLFSCQFA